LGFQCFVYRALLLNIALRLFFEFVLIKILNKKKNRSVFVYIQIDLQLIQRIIVNVYEFSIGDFLNRQKYLNLKDNILEIIYIDH